MTKNVEIYKIEIVKTNAVLTRPRIIRFLFDNKKEFYKCWRMKNKRIDTTSMCLCGYQLIPSGKKLVWQELIRYPEVQSPEIKEKKKSRKVIQNDVDNIESTAGEKEQ